MKFNNQKGLGNRLHPDILRQLTNRPNTYYCGENVNCKLMHRRKSF